jgi:hypothetical protein
VNFLARTWFHQSPRWVLENHSALELAEMQAEYDLSPWGEVRSDVQTAMGCAASLHAMGASSVELNEYIYAWDKPEESPESVMERARRIIGPELFEDKRNGNRR